MTGHAATSSVRKIRECTATPPEKANANVAISRDAPVAYDDTHKRRKDQHATARD